MRLLLVAAALLAASCSETTLQLQPFETNDSYNQCTYAYNYRMMLLARDNPVAFDTAMMSRKPKATFFITCVHDIAEDSYRCMMAAKNIKEMDGCNGYRR